MGNVSEIVKETKQLKPVDIEIVTSIVEKVVAVPNASVEVIIARKYGLRDSGEKEPFTNMPKYHQIGVLTDRFHLISSIFSKDFFSKRN